MRLAVVTGASGHVGANLIRALLAEGRRVRVLVYADVRAFDGLDVERVQADITDEASVTDALAGAEVVYHLAACIRSDQREASRVRDVNVGGTQNVVHACRRHGVRRLIHFSSIHALCHEPVDRPIDELRPLVAEDRGLVYDESKAAAERVVLNEVAQGLDAVIISPTAIIGPYDFKPSPLGGVIARLASGRMPLLVAGGFDWVDVRDVVAGARAAERCGRTGERYLLSGQWCTVRQLADMVADVSRVAAHRITVPAVVARWAFCVFATVARLARRSTVFTPEAVDILQRHRQVSSDKAVRELDYRARPLRQTLADTITWFRSRSVTS